MSFNSWGNFPKVTDQRTLLLSNPIDKNIFNNQQSTFLPRGLGRSYGDSCLNENGILLLSKNLDNFISFDAVRGILTAQSGVSLDSILQLIVPQGWFLPVTPGTKYATLGGAIANDVHGKNHHIAGSFGNYVLSFELLRSNGEKFLCSPTSNPGLFRASIGGIGLTGIITWAQIQLKKVCSAMVQQTQIRFDSLEEYYQLNEDFKTAEYTVSWVDCVNKKLRGIFISGHHQNGKSPTDFRDHKGCLDIPIYFPDGILNRQTIGLFNTFYYLKNYRKVLHGQSHYEPFFYPLDSVTNWNRIYGRRGFLQYQFVVPPDPNNDLLIQNIFKKIRESGMGSFLAVLKTFGDTPSPGYLSFPMKGLTLALDFPNYGSELFQLLNYCDDIVLQAKGRIYPAKDARMSRKTFQHSGYNLDLFAQQVDSKFSSSFWRRVL